MSYTLMVLAPGIEAVAVADVAAAMVSRGWGFRVLDDCAKIVIADGAWPEYATVVGWDAADPNAEEMARLFAPGTTPDLFAIPEHLWDLGLSCEVWMDAPYTPGGDDQDYIESLQQEVADDRLRALRQAQSRYDVRTATSMRPLRFILQPDLAWAIAHVTGGLVIDPQVDTVVVPEEAAAACATPLSRAAAFAEELHKAIARRQDQLTARPVPWWRRLFRR